MSYPVFIAGNGFSPFLTVMFIKERQQPYQVRQRENYAEQLAVNGCSFHGEQIPPTMRSTPSRGLETSKLIPMGLLFSLTH